MLRHSVRRTVAQHCVCSVYGEFGSIKSGCDCDFDTMAGLRWGVADKNMSCAIRDGRKLFVDGE
jgi:hypothetical protein